MDYLKTEKSELFADLFQEAAENGLVANKRHKTNNKNEPKKNEPKKVVKRVGSLQKAPAYQKARYQCVML